MTEKPKLHRERRATERAGREPQLAELRSRVVAQAEEIEQLRREVAWLSEELTARDDTDSEPTPSSAVEVDQRRMVGHVRRLVQKHLPDGSSLSVVSSGDESLLRHVGCKAEHLSQDRYGRHIDHPISARAALVRLEAARWRGADSLVIPQTGIWWLDHYHEFARHLERSHTLVWREGDLAAIWDLRTPSPLRQIDDLLTTLPLRPGHQPTVLDWHTGRDLAACFPDYKVFSPIEDLTRLPYLDGTVDVVAIPAQGRRMRSTEARRVASELVLSVGAGSKGTLDVVWRSPRLAAGLDDVSVVAVSRDRQPPSFDYVRRLLDSLPASFGGELVVGMDSNAVVPRLGPEAARVERIKVVAFEEDDPFPTRARRGVEAAKGEIVVVVDCAIWPVSGWLPPLVRLLRDTTAVGAVSGTFVLPDGRPLGSAEDDLDASHRRYVRALESVPDSLFAAGRELVLESEPDAFGLGDAVASRARAAGLCMLHQPETLVIAPWPGDAVDRELESADG